MVFTSLAALVRSEGISVGDAVEVEVKVML